MLRNMDLCCLFTLHGCHGKESLKIYFVQKGVFLIQRTVNFILCDNNLLPSRICMGKIHVKRISHKRD